MTCSSVASRQEEPLLLHGDAALVPELHATGVDPRDAVIGARGRGQQERQRSASRKCTLLPSLGGDCLDPLADRSAITGIDYPGCGLGAYCDATHKCQPAKPVGAACSDSYFGECGILADAFCDPQAKKCVASGICWAP